MSILNEFLKGTISVWCEAPEEINQLYDMIPSNFNKKAFDIKEEEQGFVCGRNRGVFISGNVYCYSKRHELKRFNEFEDVPETYFSDLIALDFYFDENLFYEALGVVK